MHEIGKESEDRSQKPWTMLQLSKIDAVTLAPLTRITLPPRKSSGIRRINASAVCWPVGCHSESSCAMSLLVAFVSFWHIFEKNMPKLLALRKKKCKDQERGC